MSRIYLVYHSQEKGNTRRMAELVAEGCRQVPGTTVTLVNVNERRASMDEAEAADGYALGSPDYFSYMAGGLKQFFDDLCIADWAGRKVTGKPYVAFLTHGGGGSAIHSIEKVASDLKLEKAAESQTCRGAPSAAVARKAAELGRKIAERCAAASKPASP